MNAEIFYSLMPSPIGELMLVSEGGKLTGLYMESYKHGRERHKQWIPDDGKFRDARRQLEAYFAGKLKQFNLPLAGEGTEFQKRVWKALCDIPLGETISYGELARRIGQPTASRAVGLANGQNPISIIVPCHRVIGSNGSLTGYGGGLPRKQWLLRHEGVLPRDLLA